MSTTHRKWLAVLVILTLGSYFVVACGSDGSTEETAETTATADVEESEETATTSEAAEDAEATTTTVEDTASEGVGGEYAVVSEVVGHDSTEDITVWAPDAEGSWPVVFGLGAPRGAARLDFKELATQLASHGIVFIATDWPEATAMRERMEWGDQSYGVPTSLLHSSECGYRYAHEIAADYGGDLTQPVTMLGFDKGATGVLYLAVGEAEYGPEGSYTGCFTGVARPEVIIGISGCYEPNGFPSEVGAWGNPDGQFNLIAGERGSPCGTSDAETTAELLEAQGYQVTVVAIPEASDTEPIFLDESGWLPPDHPAGQQTVQTILEAIEAAQG